MKESEKILREVVIGLNGVMIRNTVGQLQHTKGGEPITVGFEILIFQGVALFFTLTPIYTIVLKVQPTKWDCGFQPLFFFNSIPALNCLLSHLMVASWDPDIHDHFINTIQGLGLEPTPAVSVWEADTLWTDSQSLKAETTSHTLQQSLHKLISVTFLGL